MTRISLFAAALMLTLCQSVPSWAESSAPRVAPLPVDQWSPEMKQKLGVVNETITRRGGPKGHPDVMPLTFARHPELFAAWTPMMALLTYHGTLPDRARELIILRTAWLGQSPLTWVTHAYPATHVETGQKEGGVRLTSQEIDQVIVGPSDVRWSQKDAALIAAVDQFFKLGDMDDATWASLRQAHDEKQVFELMYLVTNYRMVAQIVRTLRVDLGPDFPGLRQR